MKINRNCMRTTFLMLWNKKISSDVGAFKET